MAGMTQLDLGNSQLPLSERLLVLNIDIPPATPTRQIQTAGFSRGSATGVDCLATVATTPRAEVSRFSQRGVFFQQAQLSLTQSKGALDLIPLRGVPKHMRQSADFLRRAAHCERLAEEMGNPHLRKPFAAWPTIGATQLNKLQIWRNGLRPRS